MEITKTFLRSVNDDCWTIEGVICDSVFMFYDNSLHSSGYKFLHIYIRKDNKYYYYGSCDVVCLLKGKAVDNSFFGDLRFDCNRHGVFHIWNFNCKKLKVRGCSDLSITVEQ